MAYAWVLDYNVVEHMPDDVFWAMMQLDVAEQCTESAGTLTAQPSLLQTAPLVTFTPKPAAMHGNKRRDA